MQLNHLYLFSLYSLQIIYYFHNDNKKQKEERNKKKTHPKLFLLALANELMVQNNFVSSSQSC